MNPNPNPEREREEREWRHFCVKFWVYVALACFTGAYHYHRHLYGRDDRGPAAFGCAIIWPVYWPTVLALRLTKPEPAPSVEGGAP